MTSDEIYPVDEYDNLKSQNVILSNNKYIADLKLVVGD